MNYTELYRILKASPKPTGPAAQDRDADPVAELADRCQESGATSSCLAASWAPSDAQHSAAGPEPQASSPTTLSALQEAAAAGVPGVSTSSQPSYQTPLPPAHEQQQQQQQQQEEPEPEEVSTMQLQPGSRQLHIHAQAQPTSPRLSSPDQHASLAVPVQATDVQQPASVSPREAGGGAGEQAEQDWACGYQGQEIDEAVLMALPPELKHEVRLASMRGRVRVQPGVGVNAQRPGLQSGRAQAGGGQAGRAAGGPQGQRGVKRPAAASIASFFAKRK